MAPLSSSGSYHGTVATGITVVLGLRELMAAIPMPNPEDLRDVPEVPR